MQDLMKRFADVGETVATLERAAQNRCVIWRTARVAIGETL
jgi:hypothetical protein